MKHLSRLEGRPASPASPASGRTGAGTVEAPPTLAQARRRLAAFRAKDKPWLHPSVLESPEGLPELLGPEIYRKP